MVEPTTSCSWEVQGLCRFSPGDCSSQGFNNYGRFEYILSCADAEVMGKEEAERINSISAHLKARYRQFGESLHGCGLKGRLYYLAPYSS